MHGGRTSNSPSRIIKRSATTRPCRNIEKTAQLHPPTPDLLLDWGLTYDGLNQLRRRWKSCRNRPHCAHARTSIRRSAWSTGNSEKWPEALAALANAQKAGPEFPRHLRLPRRGSHQAPINWYMPSRIFSALWSSTPAITQAQQFLKTRGEPTARQFSPNNMPPAAHRRQRSLPHTRRRGRHRNLSARIAGRAGGNRLRQSHISCSPIAKPVPT